LKYKILTQGMTCMLGELICKWRTVN